MDSITIKTYLLEFIFDLLDNPRFLAIFSPEEEDKADIRTSTSSVKKNGFAFNPFIVFESFLVVAILKISYVYQKCFNCYSLRIKTTPSGFMRLSMKEWESRFCHWLTNLL